MLFPLKESMFECLEYTGDDGYKKLVHAIVEAMNKIYETGKAVAHNGLYFKAESLKAWQVRVYGKEVECEADTAFFEVLALYANDAWQQGVRDSGKVFNIPIDIIKIYPCFKEHPPKAEKYDTKSWQYARSGMAEFDIILDSQNYLIDGYCGYLLALEHELTHIPIRYGKRQIVRAYHKQGGKLYVWELPGLLIARVSVGDKLIVPTQRGVRTVTAAAVEEYRPEEYSEPLRTVIRRKKKVRVA